MWAGAECAWDRAVCGWAGAVFWPGRGCNAQKLLFQPFYSHPKPRFTDLPKDLPLDMLNDTHSITYATENKGTCKQRCKAAMLWMNIRSYV